MRHSVDGRKFGRNTTHRKAMFANLARSLILDEEIVTTVEKAKEARRVVDRLITLGKGGSLADRRLALSRMNDSAAVEKLFGPLAKRYASRAGGYTRILKISAVRQGDAAQMAVLELVDKETVKRGKAAKVKKEVAGDPTGDTAVATPKDPFSRFRRLFEKKAK